MKLDFYKENKRWYIDLPEWNGSKDELEMIEGADILLDILSKHSDRITLQISKEFYDGCEVLDFVRLTNEIDNGALYYFNEYNLEVWLCDVTKFVLGDFPKKIFFNQISIL